MWAKASIFLTNRRLTGDHSRMSRRYRMTVGVLLVALVLATAIYIVPGLPGVPRSPAELKFAVIAEVGGPLVCTGWGLPNPAFSPYSEYPRIVSNLPTYLAILRHTKLPPGPLTDDQIVTVYRAWLNLEAVQLNWRGAYYDFREFPGPGPSSTLVNDTVGKVDLFGRLTALPTDARWGHCDRAIRSTVLACFESMRCQTAAGAPTTCCRPARQASTGPMESFSRAPFTSAPSEWGIGPRGTGGSASGRGRPILGRRPSRAPARCLRRSQR